jgi:hypothetical protein
MADARGDADDPALAASPLALLDRRVHLALVTDAVTEDDAQSRARPRAYLPRAAR